MLKKNDIHIITRNDHTYYSNSKKNTGEIQRYTWRQFPSFLPSFHCHLVLSAYWTLKGGFSSPNLPKNRAVNSHLGLLISNVSPLKKKTLNKCAQKHHEQIYTLNYLNFHCFGPPHLQHRKKNICHERIYLTNPIIKIHNTSSLVDGFKSVEQCESNWIISPKNWGANWIISPSCHEAQTGTPKLNV